MREAIEFKYRLPLSSFVLMCEGDVLEEGSEEEPKFLVDYPQIVDGCLITVTPVRTVFLQASRNKSPKAREVLTCPQVRDMNSFTLKIRSILYRISSNKGPGFYFLYPDYCRGF